MKSLFLLPYNIFLIILSLLILFFFGFYSKNFKLDASSGTLILQNDESFNYFNFYNEIFPSKNFLILAIQSPNVIDIDYIKKIQDIKKSLEKIRGVESTFSIVDAPILLANNIKISDLSSNTIQTLNNSNIDLNIVLNEFSKSPIFQDQIINTDKTVSSMIIYLNKDDKFNKIKKLKKKYFESNSKKKSEFNKLEKEYRQLKEKFNKNRNNLINEIRYVLKNEDISYKYFLGGIDMIADDTLKFIKNDIIVFSVCVFIFIFSVLFLFFRSVKWVLIPIISTTYSIICMIGLFYYLLFGSPLCQP